VTSFKDNFEDQAALYISKYENGQITIEKVLKELKWAKGQKILQSLQIPSQNYPDLPSKRLRVNFPCESCGKANGPQILCFECGKSSVHKKKCAGLTSDEWICKKCTKNNAIDAPEMSRQSSSVIYEHTVNVLIEKVVEEAKKDRYFCENLVRRQQKYTEINLELIRRNESLITIQKPEEIRRKRYENDEFSRKETEELINDLISQLNCARIPGFETTKKLIEMHGNDIQLLDKCRITQKEAALGLLKYKLPTFDRNLQLDFNSNKFERFLDRNNPAGLNNRHMAVVQKYCKLTPSELALNPSNSIVYGVAKLIIDGTLANCEYSGGNQIDHVGGGTNPESLKGLLRKIKDKYNIPE
jgi:hypothetical protein